MTTITPPVARLQLGQLLREMRESVGKSRDEAAEILECQAPKISKIETGRSTIGPGDIRLLIGLYGINGDVAETVLRLAREARKRTNMRVPDWARRFVAMESIAESIRIYEPELVPGLLQTGDYIRAITKAADPERDVAELERMVSVREARQERLNSNDPPHFLAVMNEAVIRRPVGGAEVMRAQLRRIRELAELPRMTLHILPFSAGAHVAMGSSFRLLQLNEPADVKVVYLEDLASADYLDAPAHIERYSLVFERLRIAAHSTTDTIALLERVIRESKT